MKLYEAVDLKSTKEWLSLNPHSFLARNIKKFGVCVEELSTRPTKLEYFISIFCSRFDCHSFNSWAAYEQAWSELNQEGLFAEDFTKHKIERIEAYRSILTEPSSKIIKQFMMTYPLSSLGMRIEQSSKFGGSIFVIREITTFLNIMASQHTFTHGDILGASNHEYHNSISEKYLKPTRYTTNQIEYEWVSEVTKYRSWIFSSAMYPTRDQASLRKMMDSEHSSSIEDANNVPTALGIIKNAPYHHPLKSDLVNEAYNLIKEIIFKELQDLWIMYPEVKSKDLFLNQRIYW
jgi:hypothetical protein